MYWIIRNIEEEEVIGIISFRYTGRISTQQLVSLDHKLGLRASQWNWDIISESEFETYKAFGIKEYEYDTSIG